MPSVLFVCTANICRSPMAEALFRANLKKNMREYQTWRIESAGYPAADGSIEMMSRRGMDIRDHRSQTVTTELIAGFGLVLTMEPAHKESLQAEFPAYADKIYLLSEMSGKNESVFDPIGQPLIQFEAVANQIDSLIILGMDRILELVKDAG